MDCKQCGFHNPEGMRFCGQCASPLQIVCPRCRFDNPFDFEYCGQCAAHLSPSPDYPAAAAAPGTIRESTSRLPRSEPVSLKPKDAERRQLTVLFCDMVGSSALSSRIDPEELRDVMRDYRVTCSEIVSRYDGHVAQYLGDGVLVYFGYPHAH